MKRMQKTLALCLALCLCVAIPAAAVEAVQDIVPADAPIGIVPVDGETAEEALHLPLPANVAIGGTVTVMEDGRLLVTNPNPEVSDIIISIGETTRVLDAAELTAVEASTIEDGAWVYAWVDPVMALSYPPQAAAQLVLVNIPQDYATPSYHRVIEASFDAESGKLQMLTDKNAAFVFDETVALEPYLTRNFITLEMLIPGTDMLIFSGNIAEEGETPVIAPVKALVFPYAYRGWMQVNTLEGSVTLGGQAIELGESGLVTIEGDTFHGALVPFRAAFEQAGYEVSWDAETRTAWASAEGVDAIAVAIGGANALVGGVETFLTFPASLQGGRTMISAQDMASLLGYFYNVIQ